MTIVAGFDVHRRQITVDALDTATGEVSRGQIESTPWAVEAWVAGFPGRWFMSRWRRARAGCSCPGRSSVRRDRAPGRAGGDERAAGSQTAREDRPRRRQMAAAAVVEGRLPESWLPPEHVRQWRSRARLRNTLVAERTSWVQRIRATLYHHGIAGAPDDLRTRRRPPVPRRSRAARRRARADRVALEIIDSARYPARRDRAGPARARAPPGRLPGADDPVRDGRDLLARHVVRARGRHRLHASRQAVRMAGIDIGVHRSDRHAQLGKLTRQGSAPLRWALFEAAQSASRPAAPTTPTITRSRRAGSRTPARA